METNIGKVYVNPNFTRMPNRIKHTSDTMYSNNHMYVNPNFSLHMSDIQQSSNINRKIYVNPNFIKSTNNMDKKEFYQSTLEVNNTSKCLDSNSVINHSPRKTENSNLSKSILPRPTSKSRYRLIRKNDNNVSDTRHQVKESCTIKINKYKSIPLNNFKNNLYHIAKNEIGKQMPCTQSNPSTLTVPYVNRTSFKLVKYNLKSKMNTPPKLTSKSLKVKRNNDLKIKLKVLNGNRKKNNITCRLFTKYGKCLRNTYGTCEYLHDKKHVSLCRKFIKGICHDKQCLLSHELLSKKMPTCFFYLKGMCTKEDCPYLHVKLSEKSKVCYEFLKGYCDKGDMCLNRHVKQTDKKTYGSRYTFNKHASRGIKQDILQPIKTDGLERLPENKNVKTIPGNNRHEKATDDNDCRYFKDLQNEGSMCEILKPTRCKLGTLPSFIRL